MADTITPEEYRAEISMLNHEIYELQKQLDMNKAEQERGSLIDKNDPFDNPTEYPGYNGDYSDIVPQIAIPGCKIPVEPNKGEKRRLRRFYSIGGTCMLCHFAFASIVSYAVLSLIMIILQMKNPEVSYNVLYDYAMSSSIIVALTAIIYLAANVGFSLIGLKWAKISPSDLIKTRNFSFAKAVQYCFSAIFIQYAAAILCQFVSDILSKYGISANTTGTENMAKTASGLMVLIIYQCIIAPITEELFFRGMLLKTFSRANQRFAIVATAAFFGLTHGNLPQFLLAFLIGMFLAHITIKHNSLLPSVIVHMFLNTSAMIINLIVEKHGETTMVAAAVNLIYIFIAIVGLIMFIEFTIKCKLPRTTPQQSRRGFAVAKTSVPVILAFCAEAGLMVLNILITKFTQ